MQQTNAIIDKSWALNRARSFLGQVVTGNIDFSEDDIMRCLHEETLPTLSIYMPWETNVVVRSDESRIEDGVFLIKTNERIINVRKVFEDTGLYSAYPMASEMSGGIVDRQHYVDASSLARLDITHKFSAPNRLEIFPKGVVSDSFVVAIKAVHPTHLQTIPPGAREVFRDLFLADLATDILSIRQYFQNLQTVFGEINLNLDRIQTQADRRNEIIEGLASKQLKNSTSKRIYIA